MGVIHCKAGVGRTGIVAASLLMKLKLFKEVDHAIRFLRQVRDKMCVETIDQRHFIENYNKHLNQNQ
jgi:protein-tyrosine phosphatase